jgi:long-chain-fatty-acid--CoA ligase ACSBG
MIDITMPLILTGTKDNGYTTAYFARPYDLKIGTIGERLKTVKPTLFLGVPRVWEKIQAKLTAMAAANPTTGLKKVIKDKAFASALYHHEHSQLGGDGGYPKQFPSHEFLEKKVLNVVKAALGLDECKFCGTAAAPIAKSTLDFFGKLGLTICELYGMSECTGATTFSTPQAFRTGWVGWAVLGAEVTIRASQGDSQVGEGEPTLECPNMQTGGKASDWADASPEEKQGKVPSDFQQVLKANFIRCIM